MVALRAPAGLAARVRGQKCVDLLGQQVLLDQRQELLGFSQCQAHVLNALAVFRQGEHIRNGFFTAIVGAHDELDFALHNELLRFG
jgi:hypothetical protein